MQLNIPERLVLFDVLPEKGSFLTMRAVHEMKMMLGLTPEEVARAEVKDLDGQGVSWKDNIEADIPLDVVQFQVCRDELAKLDKAGTLTADHLSLYEKFVEQSPLVAVS